MIYIQSRVCAFGPVNLCMCMAAFRWVVRAGRGTISLSTRGLRWRSACSVILSASLVTVTTSTPSIYTSSASLSGRTALCPGSKVKKPITAQTKQHASVQGEGENIGTPPDPSFSVLISSNGQWAYIYIALIKAQVHDRCCSLNMCLWRVKPTQDYWKCHGGVV